MGKSFFAILAVLSFAVVGFAPTDTTAAELTIKAPDEVKEGGGDFEVSVSIDMVSRLCGYRIKLNFYDNAVPTDELSTTVAHEFTHCLGIAHNCGYISHRGNKPCAASSPKAANT